MIIAILFLILFAILFPGTLRFLFVLLLLGGIMILGGAHASQQMNCRQAAAYQVAGEPGIHECLSYKTVSADCDAVMLASMQKRIHECEEVRRELNIR